MAVVEACQAWLRRPWDLATSSQEGDEEETKKTKKVRWVTEVRPFKFCGGHTSRGSKSQWRLVLLEESLRLFVSEPGICICNWIGC